MTTYQAASSSRFIGLFGLYFSLQYLSVSDATVLQFLAPIFTAVAGALILKEHFSKEQAFASGEWKSLKASIYPHRLTCMSQFSVWQVWCLSLAHPSCSGPWLVRVQSQLKAGLCMRLRLQLKD